MHRQYLVLVGQAGALHESAFNDMPMKITQSTWLSKEAAALLEVEAGQGLSEALANGPYDWLLTDRPPAPAKLFLADMDSTMITVECIDELADYAGLKAQVSQVTEAAMRGELDFETALRQRVALLEGLKTDVLDACYQEKVAFSPGAYSAVQTMVQQGTYCALVSGGFTFFTQRVAAHLGFHEHRANVLEERGGHLTGKVLDPISNASTKLQTLQAHQARLGIEQANSLAIGDGANDIPMLKSAGLGVAYRAKPKTKAAVDCAIDHTDLTTLLYFQGIPASEHSR